MSDDKDDALIAFDEHARELEKVGIALPFGSKIFAFGSASSSKWHTQF